MFLIRGTETHTQAPTETSSVPQTMPVKNYEGVGLGSSTPISSGATWRGQHQSGDDCTDVPL